MTDDDLPINDQTPVNNSDQEILHGSSLTEAKEKTLALIQSAHHEILIDSHQLDHQLYSHTSITEAIKSFCLGSSRAQIKILLHDNDKIRAHGHHLISVFQRLTSAIEIRLPKDDSFNEILIIDQVAFMQLPAPGSYETRYSFNHRPEAQHQQKQFNKRWEEADRDNRLLSMHI